jgi:hypothetical protein
MRDHECGLAVGETSCKLGAELLPPPEVHLSNAMALRYGPFIPTNYLGMPNSAAQ